MSTPTQQQAYSPSIGIGNIPNFLFRDRDPTLYDIDISWQKYTAWVNTITKGIWYLEAVSTSNAITTVQWRAVAPIVVSSVDPASPLTASADYAYPIGQTWVNSAGDNYFVMVANPTATTGYWIQLSSGTTGVDLFALQTGTTPIGPDSNGIVTFNGAVVAAGTHPIRTDGTASTTMTLEVQTSQAIAAADATKIGLSNFNSAHFSVDSTGFVGLVGGGQAVDSIAVDAATAPGTNPVAPNSSGIITVTGGQVATGTIGTNVIRTNSLAANTYTTQIQRSTAVAATDVTKNGVSHFNSAQFTVDANAFVSLVTTSSGIVNIQVFTNSGTYTPTAGMDYCIIECVGGGGGGAGAYSGVPNGAIVGSGGGGGGYSRLIASAATIGASKTVTIGAGGAAGSNIGGAGGTGGTTSVGAICTALGGAGGNPNNSSTLYGTGGTGGGQGTGSFSCVGGAGGGGILMGGNTSISGTGGSSFFGGSALNVVVAVGSPTFINGTPGSLYGGGGSGGADFYNDGSGSAAIGGVGAAGIVIITEFI